MKNTKRGVKLTMFIDVPEVTHEALDDAAKRMTRYMASRYEVTGAYWQECADGSISKPKSIMGKSDGK
jgi:hypothetical protein